MNKSNQTLGFSVEELQAQNEKYIQEIAQREHQIAVLNAKIEELHILSAKSQTIRSQAMQLYRSLDNRVMHTLTERGKRSETTKRHFTPIRVLADAPLSTLQTEALLYDVHEYFSMEGEKQLSTLKPHYRVAAKVYRSVRDTAEKTARKLLKITRSSNE